MRNVFDDQREDRVDDEHDKRWYSLEDYRLQWREVDDGCEIVRVTGCEDLVPSSMTDYELHADMCDGRSMYMSSDGGYLYWSSEWDDWNISDEGCGSDEVDAFSSNTAATEPRSMRSGA